MTQTGRMFLTVFPSIMLPMFMAVVDQTIVATALPAIASELGNVGRVSWVVVSYLVATTIAAPVYGQMRDRIGGKHMMFVALAIFVSASVLCALATSVEMLAAMRVLQGLGGGGLMTLSQALIGETIPPRERARYQGYLAAVMVTSSAFGPVAGGYLTQHLGWRSVFLINLPIGLLAALLTLRLEARLPRQQPWTFDLLGLGLLVGFIAPALLALEQVQRMSTDMLPAFVGLMAVAILSLVLLVRQERRAGFPLLPVTLLRNPTIWRSDALAACHGATLVSLVTFLPLYLHVGQSTSSAQTGLLLLPMMFGIGAGSMITGRIMSRTGLTMIFPSIGLMFAICTLIFLALWAAQLSRLQLGVLLFANGLFMGTVMGVVQVTVQSAAGPSSLGAAAASVQLSRSIGAAIGTALVGAIFFATMALGDPEAARGFADLLRQGSNGMEGSAAGATSLAHPVIAQAFRAAFLTIVGFAVAGLALAWSIPSRRLS